MSAENVSVTAHAAPSPTPSASAGAQNVDATKNTQFNGVVEAPKPVEGAKAPTTTEIRKLKLRLDGADLELPEEQVIALAQQSGAAQKRFLEAAQTKKQAEQVLEFLQKNPKAALERLGVDVRKFSEETLANILKIEQESPEQKKIRQTEEKLRSYEEKEKAAEATAKKKAAEEAEASKQRADAEKQAAIMRRYDDIFVKALNESGLPKNAYTIKRMAELQRINLNKKLDLDASSLAKVVKEDYDAEFRQRLPKTDKGVLDGDKILEMLDPDVIKAITKAQIAKLKGSKHIKTSDPALVPPIKESPTATGSWKDFRRGNRRPR